MAFKTNIGGIEVALSINNYKTPDWEEYYDQWCVCSYSFHKFHKKKKTETINYSAESDEVLKSSEVDKLAYNLTDLLNGEITQPFKLRMIEPDFVFMLYPIRDLRLDQNRVVAPGHEFSDIYVEWRIYFWDDGLTDNFLTITLYREDIKALRDYLESVRREQSK